MTEQQKPPRFCREYEKPIGFCLFGLLVLAFFALLGGALYGLTLGGEPKREALSKPTRIGPMVVKPGEESIPWIFDQGRNVYVPSEVTDPRFVHEESGMICQCRCGNQ